MRVVEGESNVLPPATKELSLIGTGYFIDQRRLSCQLKCFGDVTIDLSEQLEKQKNMTSRRPHGSKKSGTEVTHAVSGNFLDEDEEIKKMKVDLEKNRGKEPQKPSNKPNKSQRFSFKPK